MRKPIDLDLRVLPFACMSLRNVLPPLAPSRISGHAAYCCGPKQLVDQAWKASTTHSDNRVRFAFHHETFKF